MRQIDVLEDMGFGGFFMHSRTGLQTEYLGEDWFRLTNECADEAKKRGLEAWLDDEDRWPSGIAGGRVTKNPAYRMRSLRMQVLQGGSVPVYQSGDAECVGKLTGAIRAADDLAMRI